MFPGSLVQLRFAPAVSIDEYACAIPHTPIFTLGKGRRQTRAKSITAGNCTKYAGSRVYTRGSALFFCLVCSNKVLAAKMKFSEFVQVAKNIIRHPLVLVLLLAAAVCVCLSIYSGTYIKSFTTSRQSSPFLLEESAGQIPSHPPKVRIHVPAPAADTLGKELPSLVITKKYTRILGLTQMNLYYTIVLNCENFCTAWNFFQSTAAVLSIYPPSLTVRTKHPLFMSFALQ